MTTPKEIHLKSRELAEKIRDIADDLQLTSHQWVEKHTNKSSLDLYEEVLIDFALSAIKATIETTSNKLEKAFSEADTYNLLHGAARVRSLNPNDILEKMNHEL